MAGLNAARQAMGLETVTFRRDEAYIGVMVDDITTRGVSEPYRMFTSRAEYRLSLRADNADQRLTKLGRELDLVDEARWESFSKKSEALQGVRDQLTGMQVSPKVARSAGLTVNDDGKKRDGFDLLAFPGINLSALVELEPALASTPPTIAEQIEREALYKNYIDRQQQDIDSLRRDEAWVVPESFDYATIVGLSNELRSKLEKSRPETLAQAARIDGMTPAALMLILAQLKRADRRAG